MGEDGGGGERGEGNREGKGRGRKEEGKGGKGKGQPHPIFWPRTIPGSRSCSAAGPRLWKWNDLPPGLRRPGLTFDSFRQSLKTHLLGD